MKAFAWTAVLGTTLAVVGPMDSLPAQTASTERALKAEPARSTEDLLRAIRSPQAARERFEALRGAQKGIEAVRKVDQTSAQSKVPLSKTAPPSTAMVSREETVSKEAIPTEKQQSHRIAIQVDQNDLAVMNLALNNAENIAEYYNGRGEDVEIKIVAFGPGLHMLRADTSPVKDRIEQFMNPDLQGVTFLACANTQARMEENEGKPITILPQATIAPSGVVRLMELQEQGWSYVRP